MKETISDIVFAIILTVGILTGLFGLLCLVGLFIQGDHTEITPAGDGCYTVTVSHTNWYPSDDKILSRDLICEDK